MKRIASVQKYLSAQTVGRPMAFEVCVHDPYPVGVHSQYGAGEFRTVVSPSGSTMGSGTGTSTTGSTTGSQTGQSPQGSGGGASAGGSGAAGGNYGGSSNSAGGPGVQ
jgi:hypothetical protein